MTPHDVRCQALEMLGYTPRQAQFLVLVALHGGYFLRRQYVAFTGTPHGRATVRFLAHAVAREHVRVVPYGRQGHVYHLYARPLYAVIGEEEQIGRAGAHWVTIVGVGISFLLSLVVLKDVVVDGAEPYNGAVYTWMVVEGVRFEIGFLVDALTALIPGLSAQSAVSNNHELSRLRIGPVAVDPAYYAIKSNFETKNPGWRFWRNFRRDRAGDLAADFVFPSGNDLVVNAAP